MSIKKFGCVSFGCFLMSAAKDVYKRQRLASPKESRACKTIPTWCRPPGRGPVGDDTLDVYKRQSPYRNNRMGERTKDRNAE